MRRRSEEGGRTRKRERERREIRNNLTLQFYGPTSGRGGPWRRNQTTTRTVLVPFPAYYTRRNLLRMPEREKAKLKKKKRKKKCNDFILADVRPMPSPHPLGWLLRSILTDRKTQKSMGLEYRSGIEQMEYAIFGCNFSPILLLPTSYFLNAEAAFKTVLLLLFLSMQFTSTMLLQNDRFASLRSCCSLWIYILKGF